MVIRLSNPLSSMPFSLPCLSHLTFLFSGHRLGKGTACLSAFSTFLYSHAGKRTLVQTLLYPSGRWVAVPCRIVIILLDFCFFLDIDNLFCLYFFNTMLFLVNLVFRALHWMLSLNVHDIVDFLSLFLVVTQTWSIAFMVQFIMWLCSVVTAVQLLIPTFIPSLIVLDLRDPWAEFCTVQNRKAKFFFWVQKILGEVSYHFSILLWGFT